MRKNILLVDDDKHIQELVSFFLEQAGFVVRVCVNGFAAIDELQKNHYDLVILDILMPHLNGFKVLNSIRKDPKMKDLPVLMLSSAGDERAVQKALSNGVSDFVVKPPKREDLLGRIERVLGGKPQYQELAIVETDPVSYGSFQIGIKVKSISLNGIILESLVALPKNYDIENLQTALFSKIGIDTKKFKLVDCTQNENGQYSYFITFLDLKSEEQEKLRIWLMSETFQRRNTGQKAS